MMRHDAMGFQKVIHVFFILMLVETPNVLESEQLNTLTSISTFKSVFKSQMKYKEVESIHQ